MWTALACCSSDVPESIEPTSLTVWVESFVGPAQAGRVVCFRPSSRFQQIFAPSEDREITLIFLPLARLTSVTWSRRLLPESERHPFWVICGEDVTSFRFSKNGTSHVMSSDLFCTHSGRSTGPTDSFERVFTPMKGVPAGVHSHTTSLYFPEEEKRLLVVSWPPASAKCSGCRALAHGDASGLTSSTC